MNNFKLSVIVPVMDEEKVLRHFYKRLGNTLIETNNDYEIIFVDDGSTDSSLNILKEFGLENQNVKAISLSRNFGHQIAISVGLKFCSGDIAVIMDTDLQDPPELISEFIEKWKEGYKVVYGIRRERKEGILKRLTYKLFYRMLSMLSRINIPLDAGDFCLLDKRIIDLLNSLPERTRYLRGLRTWFGFRQIGIGYNRDKRYAGKTKYTLSKLIRLASDGILSFSEFPLAIASAAGIVIATVSMIYGLFVVFKRIFYGGTVYGWHTIVTAISFLGGIQLIILGLLGSYMAKIFDETRQRPLFIIDKMIGFDQNITERVELSIKSLPV